MAWRGGKWSGRPNLGQIEEMAVQKVAEFRHCLQAAGLSVPQIPPVPVEYLALTITELSVRGVENLLHESKPLAGLLDMERAEILYEESDPAGRQNFTIAHELGHYFLHYLPAVEMARQPTLFDALDFPQSDVQEQLERPLARYFRCSETVVTVSEQAEEEPANRKVGRRHLADPDSQAYLAKIIRLKELADRVEWEANIFARGLLMPSELVRWLSKKHSGDLAAMAEELGVTQTAMRYRLNTLNLRQDENMGIPASPGAAKPRTTNSPQQGTFF